MIAYAVEDRNHLKVGCHPELCRLGNLLHVFLGMQTEKTNCQWSFTNKICATFLLPAYDKHNNTKSLDKPNVFNSDIQLGLTVSSCN